MYRFSFARCTASVRQLALNGCVASAAALLLSQGAAVAQVVIQPVVVELGAKQRVASISIALSSRATSPLRLQADVLSWHQDLDGKPVVEYTDDLLVTPPLIEIRPGGSQVFRLALRGSRPSADELAYRLRLEDISAETDSPLVGPGVRINFRTNYDLPVMVGPTSPTLELLRWKPCPADADEASQPPTALSHTRSTSSTKACVRVINEGNRRVKVQKVTAIGTDWRESLSLREGEAVLVGTEREWRIPLSKDQKGPVRAVLIETAQGKTLTAKDGGF